MTHGLRSTYTVYGCRCPECREADRRYRWLRSPLGSMHGARENTSTHRSTFVIHTWFGEYTL